MNNIAVVLVAEYTLAYEVLGYAKHFYSTYSPDIPELNDHIRSSSAQHVREEDEGAGIHRV